MATVPTTEEITLVLTPSDVALLIESLDSHEYWQLGDALPRKDGQVFIPGDMEPDLIWEDDEPSAEQRDAIDEVAQCRRLADRLRTLLGDTSPRPVDIRCGRRVRPCLDSNQIITQNK